MAVLFVLSMSALTIGLCVAVATMPRWCFRSIQRHRLWRCRDNFADLILSGQLPKHPAVMHELTYMEGSIAMAPRVTLVNMLLFSRATSRVAPETVAWLDRRAKKPSTSGLTADQAAAVEAYHARHMRVVVGLLLVGTWVGIWSVALQLPAAIVRARRATTPADCDPPTNSAAVEAMRIATDEASSPEHFLSRHAGRAFEGQRRIVLNA